jgi:hypothetical protein
MMPEACYEAALNVSHGLTYLCSDVGSARMFMCNLVMLKKASAFTARSAAVAVLPHRLVPLFIIKVNAALVWTACGQNERK